MIQAVLVVAGERHGRRIEGWSGVTFRAFDAEKRQWSIYWVNSRDGRMQEPVVGGSSGNTGIFYGPDMASCDDGKTWETNWVICLMREKN